MLLARSRQNIIPEGFVKSPLFGNPPCAFEYLRLHLSERRSGIAARIDVRRYETIAVNASRLSVLVSETVLVAPVGPLILARAQISLFVVFAVFHFFFSGQPRYSMYIIPNIKGNVKLYVVDPV